MDFATFTTNLPTYLTAHSVTNRDKIRGNKPYAYTAQDFSSGVEQWVINMASHRNGNAYTNLVRRCYPDVSAMQEEAMIVDLLDEAGIPHT